MRLRLIRVGNGKLFAPVRQGVLRGLASPLVERCDHDRSPLVIHFAREVARRVKVEPILRSRFRELLGRLFLDRVFWWALHLIESSLKL